MTYPAPLKPGDTVAIISPASVVNPDYIDGAARFFEAEGFRVIVMPHAKGPASGSYAASDADRLADILAALRDPGIRAILCARGGYGCNHLLPHIPLDLIASDPKWLVGFSDISALHALWLRAGVPSLHAPMAKHLTLLPPDHYCTRTLIRFLTEPAPLPFPTEPLTVGGRVAKAAGFCSNSPLLTPHSSLLTPPHPLNHPGTAEGILIGGNLAVINGLSATPFDPLGALSSPASVACDGRRLLFIEDIAEQIYAVERMLIRMLLAGQLRDIAGLIVGHFTEYRPDRNHPDMETMISRLLDTYADYLPSNFPVAFGFPAGHTDDNLPLLLGAPALLEVTPDTTRLIFNPNQLR